ncbi:S26 family signal peptidase [Natrarchaeobius oligotrophus]|uniref:S26 family signal peptidase n=1 Tax=Natrarchaeobius chitinivorans TaxID=1679083 RepID=A0A3N6NN53_NATCH|nr:S26 family signal peptidase [Natrarchaeobius chitinivorans]RQH00933.1 S26 family signal peptidase [Natrarchaeobius chitinivorans]
MSPPSSGDSGSDGSDAADDPSDGTGFGSGDSDGGASRTADSSAADASDSSPAGGSSDGGTPSSSRDGGRSRSDDVTIEDDGVVRWFLGTDDGTVVVVRDVLSSVALVAVIGLILFAASGIWPPLVAVESGSMEPNMERGDLIFVVDDDRYAGDGAVDGTGIVTHENGDDHEKFGQPGDVIIFKPDGSEYRTPIIHRAHFWVEEGENWVDSSANEEYLGGATCDEVPTCPATHDGFVTKGDDNSGYDQYGGAATDVVKPEWVTGKAMIRVPWLGHVRLLFDSLLGGLLVPQPTIDGVVLSPTQPGVSPSPAS